MDEWRHCFITRLTSVSFQFLNHFPGLKVPDKYTIVLTTAYDPFATRDRETTKDAVGLVFVSCIRLETLSCMVVPKTYCIIQCRCQNELAVW